MSTFHAVVWTDHQSAQVLQFDAEHVLAQKIRTHTYHTAQHGSAVRSEHEFFGEICDALDGIGEVLVTGSHTAIAVTTPTSIGRTPRAASSLTKWWTIRARTSLSLSLGSTSSSATG